MSAIKITSATDEFVQKSILEKQGVYAEKIGTWSTRLKVWEPLLYNNCTERAVASDCVKYSYIKYVTSCER